MSIGINLVNKIIERHIEISLNLKSQSQIIESFCISSLEALKSGNKILICGNGGSASDSNHFAAELVGKFENKDRKSLPAISLCSNESNITAIANDFGFEKIFSKQIEALGSENDILIAISTSGKSENILKAIKTAESKKMNVLFLTGINREKVSSGESYKILNVGSKNTARVQEMHILVLHIICHFIDSNI
ncbi:SIS domain-containing protein [Candidatus Marinimicrobia bacterium]|nr:SIS domain-containing protein [Candidatus Neomarinimicrobiota bacterium]